MQAEIASRLELKRGRPSREAVQYKRNLMQVCVRHGAGALVRRLLLATVPNGDWRAHKVQFYVDLAPKGMAVDQASVLQFVTGGLMGALAASQPCLYPRHRWVGADIAVSELAVLEGCHRLLSTTFAQFCAAHTRGAARDNLHALARTLNVYDAAVAEGDTGGELEDEEEATDASGVADENIWRRRRSCGMYRQP